MAIKLGLKQLVSLFAEVAANEKVPLSIRQFAAQLIVLAGHVDQIHGKINTETAARQALEARLDEQIAELATAILASRTPTSTPVTQTQQVTPTEQSQPIAEMNEEDEAKAMAEKVMLETAAEVAAIARTPIPEKSAAITPLRATNAGNKVPSTAQEAS